MGQEFSNKWVSGHSSVSQGEVLYPTTTLLLLFICMHFPFLTNTSLPLAFQNNYNIPKHRTQEERCAAARLLLSHNPPCTVRVDTMLDAANLAYGASPERLYIIRDSRIVYQGGPGPMSYSTHEVRIWLENYAGRRISHGARHEYYTLWNSWQDMPHLSLVSQRNITTAISLLKG